MTETINHQLLENVRDGNIELVKKALNDGADINFMDADYNGPPICEAAQYQHHDIVKLLIESGADIYKNHSYSALAYAISNKDSELVQYLLQNNANPKGYMNQASLLTHASYSYNLDTKKWVPLNDNEFSIVKMLLASGATTDTRRGDYPPSPLEEPIRANDIRTVKILIEHGAKLTTVPILMSANFCAAYGQYDMLKLLLENKWKPNPKKQKDRYLASPLHYAIKNGHSNIVKLLIEYKVNVNYIPNDCPNDTDPEIRLFYGIHSLSFAIKYKQYETLKLLLENNANPYGVIPSYFVREYDVSPIMTAVNEGDIQAVNILSSFIDINKGYKVERGGGYPIFGEDVTPLKLAIKKDDQTMVDLLKTLGEIT